MLVVSNCFPDRLGSPFLFAADPADERRYKREELKAETPPFFLFPPVKPIESLRFQLSVLQLFLRPHPRDLGNPWLIPTADLLTTGE
jgi:hypothetical protein